VASISFAQNLDKKITIEAHDQPLGKVIDEISKKGNILFSYSPQVIPVDKKITVVARKIMMRDTVFYDIHFLGMNIL